MTQADWEQLSEFVHAANDARQVICKAAKHGTQQVALTNKSIDLLRATEAPPEFWMKLGNLIGQELRERQEQQEQL